MSLESSEAGHRLWVHAPAVAERVGFGSALDHYLRNQAAALCLGSSWLPLLTPALSKAAGFKSGSSEAALSVLLEFSPEGVLEHYRFCRSTIRVDGVVDTNALQALAERKPKARTTPAALKALKDQLPLLEQLIELAQLLRQQRLAGGSIDLDLAMPAIDGLGDLAIPEPDESRQGWLVQLDPASTMWPKQPWRLKSPWSSRPTATPAPRSWRRPLPAAIAAACCSNSCGNR